MGCSCRGAVGLICWYQGWYVFLWGAGGAVGPWGYDDMLISGLGLICFFLVGWWYRGPVPKSERKSPLHCLQWPPDLNLVLRAALFRVSPRMKMMETPWPKAIVCVSAVEKTSGCWTVILGSWFSITHAIVLFGLCYYSSFAFSCFIFLVCSRV